MEKEQLGSARSGELCHIASELTLKTSDLAVFISENSGHECNASKSIYTDTADF